MIATVAGHQLRSLLRQRVIAVLLIALMAMTAAAGVIGWSSHSTIERVYGEATRILAAQGQPAPPDPFRFKPPLSLLSNMAIYLGLVGGLLAIVLGHLTVAEEHSDGIGRLVFTRKIPRAAYGAGKMLAAAAALAVALSASSAVSAASLTVVNGELSSTDAGRLALFYALSWLYLMVFALLGMATTLGSRRRSLGLLWALGAWLVVTFALPQITSGLRPVASLNPVVSPAGTSQAFFRATAHARAVSINEQYKKVSGQLLQTDPAESASRTAWRVVPIGAATVALMLIVFLLVRRHDYTRAGSDA